MKRAYPVYLTETKDEQNTVLVEVPDMQINTEGYGIADAIYMARDAIGSIGISLEDDGELIPEPSDPADIAESEFADIGNQLLTFVDIDFKEYRRKVDNKSVRRNVTIPNWLDRDARKAGLNMSRVLQEALKAELGVA